MFQCCPSAKKRCPQRTSQSGNIRIVGAKTALFGRKRNPRNVRRCNHGFLEFDNRLCHTDLQDLHLTVYYHKQMIFATDFRQFFLFFRHNTKRVAIVHVSRQKHNILMFLIYKILFSINNAFHFFEVEIGHVFFRGAVKLL